ncbi:MAG: M1 family metallopeptidase [Crocinitomicaceae bacterium]|nr:M1 family metallopeptidase [Crocinitomicaceae bacterium]
MRFFSLAILSLISILFIGCDGSNPEEVNSDEDSLSSEQVQVTDMQPHSYANLQEVRTTHLHLDLTADFDTQTLSGSVTHSIKNLTESEVMILDVRNLEIQKVEIDGEETTYKIEGDDPLMGSGLYVDIKPSTEKVKIYYSTTDGSDGLQWLNPQQTAGKKHPYMYSQGQAILTRTWIPCQDAPRNRITYSADLQVPSELMAVMSATNPTEKSEDGKFHFEMNNKIPSYLIAIAVGDLTFASLGERSGVYTEPSELDNCVYELVDVEKMIDAAENLYGEYKWGRYDIIVLPPSFPFGGMENPKLTFATPTIISGDRSLVSLIAHELAHSWSGNLVTNATWDDFWLNEGFTVYFENRIMEAIYGKEHADMLMSIEVEDLEQENDDILNGEFPEDTQLKLDLDGRDPDVGMTAIAYVKGAMFLKSLEAAAGRETWDAFLKGYFDAHEFQVMTTEEFVDYLHTNLLDPNSIEFNTDEWIYEEGIPASCIKIESDKFAKVEEVAVQIHVVESMKDLGIVKEAWSTQEWIHFVRNIGEDVDVEDMGELDALFNFSGWGNSEIMAAWYVVSIEKGYEGIYEDLEGFLMEVGRRKFLEPIYQALADNGKTDWANAVYAQARPNYHAISYGTIDDILGWEE